MGPRPSECRSTQSGCLEKAPKIGVSEVARIALEAPRAMAADHAPLSRASERVGAVVAQAKSQSLSVRERNSQDGMLQRIIAIPKMVAHFYPRHLTSLGT
jgi:hypothetical protein